MTNPTPTLELIASPHFAEWLVRMRLSLAFSTYQSGKLFMIGLQPNGRLSIYERTFNRAMGLWGNGQTLYLSTMYQMWRFENTLARGEQHEGYDRLYIPRLAYTTGDIDIHDVAVDADGEVLFVSTLFNCIARLSATHSFAPVWQPPFISRLVPEDRCHLNGMALRDGQPAYATSVSRTDVVDGWREHRQNGGIVTDIQSNEVIATGLSMPHSPRWYADTLWVLNAGTGEFGRINQAAGQFEPLVFCPGFLRGMAFAGNYAIVGTSKARENRTFQGLTLDDNLRARGVEARCALYVIDLSNGTIAHWLRLEGFVEELYDVITLPGVRRPMALGTIGNEIERFLTIEPS